MSDDSRALAPVESAAELVQQGEAIYRIENETLMKVAIERPRVEAKVLAAALAELDLAPDEAPAAYYSIPYKQDGQTTLVEGPSIKAAMALARRWGNCSAGGRVLTEDATGFTVEGVFIDYETMFRVTRPHRVSRFIKRRDGRTHELAADRLVMSIQAGVSKAMRNAVLQGLPAYYVNQYFKKAKKITAGGNLDETAKPEAVAKVVAVFARWNVTPEDLEAKLELPRNQWTNEEIGTLRGLWQAIKDKETTIEDEFPDVAKRASKPAEGAAAAPVPVSALDKLADKMAVVAGVEPPQSASVSTAQPAPPSTPPATPPPPPQSSKAEEDGRTFMLTGLRMARRQIKPPLTDAQYEKAALAVCGSTDLAAVDMSALHEFCLLLQGVAERDKGAEAALAALLK